MVKTLLTEGDRLQVFGLVRNQRRAAKALDYGSSRVHFIHGNVTKPETLVPACQGMDAVVCTVRARAGCRLPCWNRDSPRCVEYEGVKDLAEAATSVGVPKFVLVSAAGVTTTCGGEFCLNIFHGRALHWKLLGEEALRRSYKHGGLRDLSYYIIRPGRLSNNLGGLLGCSFEQGDQGRGSITRIDVAAIVVACIDGHCIPNVTFEAFNNKNKLAPAEDLNKFYFLDPDEPVAEGAEITSRLLP